MNEKQFESKQNVLRIMLGSIECRLCISKLDNKPVQTNYALVHVTHLDSREIQFTSPLLLPVTRQMTLSFKLALANTVIHFKGSRIKRKYLGSDYHYEVEYEMDGLERAMFISTINHIMGEARFLTNRALSSYSSYYSYDHCIPSHSFQT